MVPTLDAENAVKIGFQTAGSRLLTLIDEKSPKKGEFCGLDTTYGPCSIEQSEQSVEKHVQSLEIIDFGKSDFRN